jgi:hypothetical protein
VGSPEGRKSDGVGLKNDFETPQKISWIIIDGWLQ